MKIKHTLSLALSTLAVASGVSAAVVTHNDATHKTNAPAAHHVTTRTKQTKQATLAATSGTKLLSQDEAIIKKLHAQCQLGLNAYNDMTTYAKVRMTKPDCSL